MGRTDSRPSRLAVVAQVILIVAALRFAQGLFLPLALATILSLLLLPLVKGVERSRMGRVPSIVIVVLTAFLVIGAFGWITIHQMSELGKKLPAYKGQVLAKLGSLGPVGEAIKNVQAALAEVGDEVAASMSGEQSREKSSGTPKVEIVLPPSKPLDIIGRTLVSAIVPLGTTFFVLVLVIFILIYHFDLMDRFVHTVGDSRVNLTTQTVAEAVRSVSRYLFLQAAVNTGFGIVVASGLWALGLPNALFFGMLAALSRFVPYVGTWVAALPPFLLSVAVSQGWTQPLAILGGWIVLEILIANVVEPWLYGARTGLSPLAVILSAFFWTWLWGGTGLLLAIPLTVSLVVLGKHLPQFAFLQTLLGRKARLEPKVQLYNRLLALDQQETVDLVDRYQEGKTLQEVYDGLILPALCLAESDRQHGLLEEERETTLLTNISDLIQDLGERDEEEGVLVAGPPAATSPNVSRIVCLPAARPADRLAASMLTRLLVGKDWRMDTAPENATAGEMMEFIAGSETDLVVISALPPSSLLQVRYLCKRIRRVHPKVAVVIGLWNDPADAESLETRIRTDSDVYIVRSLAEALDRIRQICQGRIPPLERLDTPLQSAPR